MSITSQPLGVYPVHLPIIYGVQAIIPSVPGETLKNIVVTATKVSTGETFTFRQSFETVVDNLVTIVGDGNINLSAIAKTFFCNDGKLTAFGILGTEYNAINPDSIEDLDVQVTYQKVNTSGILEDIGVIDNAITLTLLNAIRQICEDQNLNAYVTAASDRCFLTNRPEVYPICFTDDDFLQYWTTGISHFRVEVFDDNSGTPRAIGAFSQAGGIPADTVATIGAGVNNINDIAVWSVGPVTILPTDVKYTITAGVLSPGFVFTPVTKEQCFKIFNCCEETKCSLFFLNRLGGVDRYTFDGIKIVSDNPTSNFYEKVRASNPILKSDYGRQKEDSRDKTLLTLSSKNLCEDVAEWIRELQTSTRVYKQVDETDCISVVVRDSNSVISNRAANFINKSITIEYSVDPCIQNNV